MIQRRKHLLMSAIAAALSVGGFAAAAPGVVLRHTGTGQTNDFDDQAAADNFMANVADPASWAQDVHGKKVELALESTTYTDGTGATGTAPLPEVSPAQQDAAEALAAPAGVAAEVLAATDAAPAGDAAAEPAPVEAAALAAAAPATTKRGRKTTA